MHTKRSTGLSLIEVLVVVAIVSVLLGLLMGATSSIRKTAMNAACVNNLKQWGISFASIYADKEELPETARYQVGPSGRIPPVCFFWMPAQDVSDFFNVNWVKEYTSGFSVGTSPNTLELDGMWVCPFQSETVAEGYGVADQNLYGNGFVHLPYAYYARRDLFLASDFTDPDNEITEDKLDVNRIVMADTLYRSNGSGSWIYNHGESSSSWLGDMGPQWGESNSTDPDITGVNRLYGDGSVQWKGAESFDLIKMDAGAIDIPNCRWGAGRAYH